MKKSIAVFLMLFPFTGAYCGTMGNSDFNKTGLTLYGGREGSTADVALLKNSTGVKPSINTTNAGYAAIMQHQSGSLAFGIASDIQTVYAKTVTKGVYEKDPSAADGTFFTTGCAWAAERSLK
ncbi:MAG: hypothetical protein FPO08_02535 [Geobacter sp.]|nr:MAG: hypothetical protein FPO08_02535 [Geobacter sp.]